MQSDKEKLAHILALNDLDLDTLRVMDGTVLSVNPNKTVNVMVSGVPIMAIPSDRGMVGACKVLRAKDGRVFII